MAIGGIGGNWAIGQWAWTVGSGQWAVGIRGNWAVGSGQWAMVLGSGLAFFLTRTDFLENRPFGPWKAERSQLPSHCDSHLVRVRVRVRVRLKLRLRLRFRLRFRVGLGSG